MKNLLMLPTLVFVLLIAACDDMPTRQETFENVVLTIGTPSDATNIKFIDEEWYTFEWRGQCFLGMNYWRWATVTKIDCEDKVPVLVLKEDK